MRFMAAVMIVFLISSCQDGSSTDTTKFVGHWEGTLTKEGKNWRVNLDLWQKDGDLVGTIDAVDQGRYGIAITRTKVSEGKLKIVVETKSGEFSSEGELSDDRIIGQFSGFDIKAAMDVRLVSREPVKIVAEHFTVQSDGAVLAATLLKPMKPGPYPAIVLGHGSGQWLRSIDSYRSRAVLFARNGIAALIYDRRGQGESSGESDRILPIATLAADMVAAVSSLSIREDIIHDRIGVYGLSQSGWSAPLAAARSKKVAFVVTVSAAGITPDAQNDFVIANQADIAVTNSLANVNIPKEELMKIRQRERELLLATAAARLLTDTVEIVPGVSHFDPLPVWKQIDVPVLCLWGDRDIIVPAPESMELITKALSDGGNEDVTPRMIPDATHTLELARNPGSNWDWDRQAPGVDSMMVEWLQSRTGLTSKP